MNNETPTTNESSVDILSDIDVSYQYASTGQRFLNYFIDNLILQYGLSFVSGILVALVFEPLNPGLLDRMTTNGTSEYWLFLFIILVLNYILYYPLCEKLFHGRTIGKLVTGTKAVKEDGSPLSFKDALLRSLVRMVPFEPLSGFGTPWHDSWTNTTVIKAR